MTNNEAPAYRTIDRAPEVGDQITVTPVGTRLFEVLALDAVDGKLIYATPTDTDGPAQWYPLTYVKVIDNGPEHPMEIAPADDARRCFYSNVPAVAYEGRSGYVDVLLLKDPGYGSMFITGTAPGNVTWVDPPFTA